MSELDGFYRTRRRDDRISIDFGRDIAKARRVAQTVAYPTAVAKSAGDDGFGTPNGVPMLNGIVVPLLPH